MRQLRAALYTRVSTSDQKTIPQQIAALRKYAKQRGWKIAVEVPEVGSGASTRPLREQIMKQARRREIDVICVWRLDRWGRSVADLALTLKELHGLGVAFVSLTEALDLTTPSGRAMAGLLSVFAEFERDILRERVLAGLAAARKRGTRLGRPATARARIAEVERLRQQGLSTRAIAERLRVGETSVRRLLTSVSETRGTSAARPARTASRRASRSAARVPRQSSR